MPPSIDYRWLYHRIQKRDYILEYQEEYEGLKATMLGQPANGMIWHCSGPWTFATSGWRTSHSDAVSLVYQLLAIQDL